MPIDLKNIASGYNLSAINENFQKIEEAWDEKLDRLVSQHGNQMEQDLDMNGFRILNTTFDTNAFGDIVEELETRLEQTIQDVEDVRDQTSIIRDETELIKEEARAFRDQASNEADRSKEEADRSKEEADEAKAAAKAAMAFGNYEGHFIEGETQAKEGSSYLYEGFLWICLEDTNTTPEAGNPAWYGEEPQLRSFWSSPVTMSEGQTVLAVPEAVFVSFVVRDGTVEQTNLWEHDKEGNTLTLLSPAAEGEVIQVSFSNVLPSEVAPPLPPEPPEPPEIPGRQTYIIPLVSDITSFDSSEHEELVYLKTTGHTQVNTGASTYVKVDSSNETDAFGFVVEDASGQKWMIDIPGTLYFEQLGALPSANGGGNIAPIVQKAMQIQSLVGCVLNHESSGEFLFTSSAGPMMGGENSTKIIVDKPRVMWNGFSSTQKFTMLDAPVDVARGLRVEGLFLIPSKIKDQSVPNPRLDPEGYTEATSWGINWTRCRNGSHLSKITFVAGGNGIVATDLYYSAMSDIDLRGIEPDGIGLLEYAKTSATQVNGVHHRNVKLHNGIHALCCVAYEGVNVDANTYENCYFENTIGVAAYFVGWRNTLLINPYFENNHQSVSADGVTDIFARNSTITIRGGLINSPSTGSGSNTQSIAQESGGFIKLDDGVRLRRGGRTAFARGNIIWGLVEPIDFTQPGGARLNPVRRAGNVGSVVNLADSTYMNQTTVPLAYLKNSDDLLRVLWVIDLTTAQFRESWMFDVDITSTTHGNTPGGVPAQGCVTLRHTVRKEGASYTLNTAVMGEIKNQNSNFGTYSSSMSGSTVLIRFSPSGNVADTRALLHPILCGSNSRVAGILEGY